MARPRPSLVAFVAAGLTVAALLVILVAPRASSSPDGLEKVAAEKGIDSDARPHALGAGPFADYGTDGVQHAAMGTVVAGFVGIVATFVVCAALVYVVRRRRDLPPSPATPSG